LNLKAVSVGGIILSKQRKLTMNKLEKIRQAVTRSEDTLSLRPQAGRGTLITKVRLVDGMHSEIEDGKWRLAVDGSPSMGGDGVGPTPGVFGRAALGSCLIVGYVVWAAKLNIPLTSLEVEVQADYDERGFYGLDDVSAGYSEIRYTVHIDSPAPEAEIHRLLALSEAHSPWLTNINRPVNVKRLLHIRGCEMCV
jgi:uncharacterized OsmC-like protein